MNTLTGQVIRGYEVGRQVGAGGYGAVYRAFQPTVGREVAIKVILPQYASLPEFERRFESEARMIARLEHPHIVPVYDFWRDDLGAFMVMRWLPNNLRIRLQEGPLPLDQVLHLVEQIASALSIAHQHGVVHRDLKPDNILLDDHRNAYLSDFGIAKNLNVDSTSSKSGVIVGSPAYLAPEQIQSGAITPRTDLYSFGLVIYEMLAGERPFSDSDIGRLMYMQLYNPLPPLAHLRPDLPYMLNELLHRATAKKAEDRFADAPQLANAFRAIYPGWSLNSNMGVGSIQPDLIATREVAQMGYVATTDAPRLPVAALPDATFVPSQIPVIRGDLKAKYYEKAELILAKPRQLFGREDVMARVHLLLDTCDRVLLHGFGGIGKTSLAATIAAERITSGKGAVIWLEMGTEAADSLFEAIARTFDCQNEIASKTGDDRVQAVREMLLEKQALLVLDNIWNERALFQFIKAIPPTMPVLMTSRHTIALDGEVVEVDTLPRDKALALLAYHARTDYSSDPAAQSLCEKLGCHPFALEIAGKRLKVEKDITPKRLLENIADAPHDLKVPGGFSEVGREGIKDLLDESLNELSTEQKRLFANMGGLASPVASIQILAMMIDENAENLAVALSDLQQRGLIELVAQTEDVPAHYRMHDLTHSYACALFMVQWADHQITFVEAARRFVEQHAQDFDLLEFDQPNILGAAGAAAKTKNYPAFLSIMEVLALRGYLNARGHTPLFLERLNEAIGVARLGADDNKELLHHLLSKCGNVYADRGDLDNALKCYQEALELAPNPNRTAILLSVVGMTLFRKGDSSADEYLERAYQTAKDHQDDMALSFVLGHRGAQAMLKKDYESARRYLGESAEVSKRLGDTYQIFTSLQNLGSVQEMLGFPNEALATHQMAFEIAKTEENLLWMGFSLHSIGEDYHRLHDRDNARLHLDQALSIYRKVGATSKESEITEFMRNQKYEFSSK